MKSETISITAQRVPKIIETTIAALNYKAGPTTAA